MEKLQSMEQFEKLKKEERIIFMFCADWCPDCKFLEPSMPRIEVDYPEYIFIHVSFDDYSQLSEELNISGIPGFVAYHNGEEAGRFVNKDRKTPDEVEDFINGISN